MKKHIYLIITLVLSSVLFVNCRKNDKGVKVKTDEPEVEAPKDSDEVPFVDDVFKKICLEMVISEDGQNYTPAIDTNNDKKISVGEAKAFNGNFLFNVESVEYEVNSLEDLKWFPNIKSFTSGALPNVDKIDLSNNIEIETLTLMSSKISQINCSKLEKLKNITITNNENLANLDLSNCPLMEFVYISNCVLIQDLNVSKGENMVEIILSESPQLAHVTFPQKMEKMNSVTIDSVQFDILDMVSRTPNITRLDISRPVNLKGVLDLSKLNKLTNLTVIMSPELNDVESVLFPNSSTMTSVTVTGSKSKSYDISSLSEINYLDFSQSPNLEKVNIANGNNSNITFLAFLDCPKLNCIQVDPTMKLPIDFGAFEEGSVYWNVDLDANNDPIPTFSYDCFSANTTRK